VEFEEGPIVTGPGFDDPADPPPLSVRLVVAATA